MPRTPAWTSKIPTIRESIARSPAFAFDRAALADLFGVSQRQAANLLAKASAERIGGAFILPRERLLDFLEGRGAEATAERENTRREALKEKLAAIRAAGPRLRAVRVSPPAADSLPPGVALTAPGELRIHYSSPGAVLGVLLALAELSEANPAAFATALTYPADTREEA